LRLKARKPKRDMPKSKDTEQERTCKVMRLLVEAESQSGPVIVDREESD